MSHHQIVLHSCARARRPVRSIRAEDGETNDRFVHGYLDDGEIHDETEYLLIITTTGEKLDLVRSFIDRVHSYEVPEFIAFEAACGLPEYLQWVRDVTT